MSPAPARPRAALSRRGFLLGCAGTITATTALGTASALIGVPAAAAEATRTVWLLDSDWGYPRGRHGRASCLCRACVLHAQNKVFATLAAADDARNRAHAECLCVPVAQQIPSDAYAQLFARGSVCDRRTPGVAAVLAGVATTTPHPGSGGAPSPTPSGSASGSGSSAGSTSTPVHAPPAALLQPPSAAPLRPALTGSGPTDPTRAAGAQSVAAARTSRSSALPDTRRESSDLLPWLGGAVAAGALGGVLWLRRRNEEPDIPDAID